MAIDGLESLVGIRVVVYRGEGGVGFLVREVLVDEVEFVSKVRYEESVWMKVRGGRGREALYVCCIYMPTDSACASVIEDSYIKLKETCLDSCRRGGLLFLVTLIRGWVDVLTLMMSLGCLGRRLVMPVEIG